MSQSADREQFQRAAGAPLLPATPVRFVLHFVARRRWWFLTLIALEAANSACGISIPLALSRIIKAVTRSQSHSMALLDNLTNPLLLFLALGLGEVLFGSLGRSVQLRISPRQRQEVTRETYAYLQHHSHRYFNDNFAGALVHRISEMSQGVNMTLWTLIIDFWPVVITFTVSIVLLFRANLRLGALVGSWAIAFIAISFLLARKSRPYAVKAAAARSETTGKVVDSVTNLTSAKLFARLGFERSFLDRYLDREMRATQTSLSYTERIRRFQYLSSAVLKVAVVWYSLRLWGQGKIDVGEFVMATSMALLLITESRNLSRRFLEFFEFTGNIANGVNTLIRPHELIDAPDARAVTIRRGAIEFRRVGFAYTSERKIFDALSVSIPAGQRVGLVGLSGSGKSTFVSLILRMHDPQTGQILIDGVDIRAFTQETLHAQLSLIPQDPSLFHRSLKENIRYGRIEASDAEVESAARRAHAHEFIDQIPEKYEFMVGERGVKLSGGQRQRIAIARVILKDAPVLILDEATSSLDSITEKSIQNSLNEVMQGKTVIVVAHRLSTIANLDRILVFDEGRIIEDGRPADLIAKQGAYYRLWSRQADGFLGGSMGPASPKAETVRDEVGFVSSPSAVEETPGESDDNEPASVAVRPVPQFART
jgi:ATP-binding cassette subfamily B protein